MSSRCCPKCWTYWPNGFAYKMCPECRVETEKDKAEPDLTWPEAADLKRKAEQCWKKYDDFDKYYEAREIERLEQALENEEAPA